MSALRELFPATGGDIPPGTMTAEDIWKAVREMGREHPLFFLFQQKILQNYHERNFNPPNTYRSSDAPGLRLLN